MTHEMQRHRSIFRDIFFYTQHAKSKGFKLYDKASIGEHGASSIIREGNERGHTF